jgi:hypothetical protein
MIPGQCPHSGAGLRPVGRWGRAHPALLSRSKVVLTVHLRPPYWSTWR